jgi:dipeptidyl aminopeptidase/acylaminoacyl peptidase
MKRGIGPTDLNVVISLLASCGTAAVHGWTLADLLQPPDPSEIAAVQSEWRARDLTPIDVRIVATHRVHVGGAEFKASIVSFSVAGLRQYGVLFLPAGAVGAVPLILDIRGVEPGYPVRRLDEGPFSATVVTSPEQQRFAFAVPSLRGHAIELAGQTYASEGDRRESWDGATDDAIAFLTSVLALDEPVDRERVGVFGASRGGSVALLMAARDPRLDAAVAFAPATDWFALMARPGEDWLETLLAAESPRGRDQNTREAQFLEWFVDDRRQLPLAEARRRIIASSPLYFRSAGAAIQVHHGVDDRPVPVRNSQALERRLGREVLFYDKTGHDLSKSDAPNRARQFLREHLSSSTEHPRGRANGHESN